MDLGSGHILPVPRFKLANKYLSKIDSSSLTSQTWFSLRAHIYQDPEVLGSNKIPLEKNNVQEFYGRRLPNKAVFLFVFLGYGLRVICNSDITGFCKFPNRAIFGGGFIQSLFGNFPNSPPVTLFSRIISPANGLDPVGPTDLPAFCQN